MGVRPGMVITQAQADAWLAQDIELAGEVLSSYVTAQLTQNQFDAVTDFIYNIGRGMPGVRDGFVWLRNGNHSTIMRLLNQGDMGNAALEFMKWNLPPLAGILLRREVEKDLFTTP